MSLQTLTAGLKEVLAEESEIGTLAVIEESETDIVVDDFQEDRTRYFHIVAPTEEWLKSRILWAPSIKGDTESWSAWLTRFLLPPSPELLIPLNRIIIMEDTEEDIEAICDIVGREPCEFPDFEKVLGIKWHYESSVIVNLSFLRACVEKEVELYQEEWRYHSIMVEAFLITLLHELRHLAVDNADLYDADLFHAADFGEDATEDWARDEYFRLTYTGRNTYANH